MNPEEDPFHFVEDGAAATQNMCLAACSLGLATYWTGVFNAKNDTNSPETKIKEILHVPEKVRLIAVLPIGTPMYLPQKTRKSLNEIVSLDRYGEPFTGKMITGPRT